jgi:hypothetical protein
VSPGEGDHGKIVELSMQLCLLAPEFLHDQDGFTRSPPPFIARIPLTCSLLLPLLISLLLFLLLGTAPSPVFELFLIHLLFVR